MNGLPHSTETRKSRVGGAERNRPFILIKFIKMVGFTLLHRPYTALGQQPFPQFPRFQFK